MGGKSKSAVLNTFASFGYEIVSVLAGFILPRFILLAYGSDVNGLLSSITQFLSFITFCEAGVGAVVKSNLYKPLANKDTYGLSCILKSSQRYFRLIAIILCAYTVGLMCIFPLITRDFSWIYTSSLVLIISTGLFSQYYFGLTNQLLLYADHKAYIPLGLTIVVVVLNTAISVLIIDLGGSIHMVKLITATIFFMKPICLYLYVNKHYNINQSVKYEGEPLKQKWNGFAQHIATISQDNAGIIILTLLSTLSNVSIYAIYLLVVNGVKQLVFSVNASISPLIGELYAKGDVYRLKFFFGFFEWFLHNVSVILFTITGILIVPFVMLYTEGITDTNYDVPFFAYTLSFAVCIRCVQICYNIMIQCACHFKETQTSSIIETVLNIGTSLALVPFVGLLGVSIGLSLSLIYRLIYFCFYLRTHILYRPVSIFFKQLFIDLVISCSIVGLAQIIIPNITNYSSWIGYAVLITIVSILVSIIINYVFYPKEIILLKSKLHGIKKR